MRPSLTYYARVCPRAPRTSRSIPVRWPFSRTRPSWRNTSRCCVTGWGAALTSSRTVTQVEWGVSGMSVGFMWSIMIIIIISSLPSTVDQIPLLSVYVCSCIEPDSLDSCQFERLSSTSPTPLSHISNTSLTATTPHPHSKYYPILASLIHFSLSQMSRSWLKVNLSCSILTLFPSFTFLTESQPIMQYPHIVSLIHIPDWKSTYHAVSSLCFPHSRSWLKVNLSCSILTLFPSFTFLAESQPIMQYPRFVSLIHIPGWKSTYHAVSSPCFPHSHSWLKVNLSCSILTLFPSFTFLAESQPIMQYPHIVSLIHIPDWKSTYHAVSSLCFPHSHSWLKVNLPCSILTLFPSFTFLTESQPTMQYPDLVSLIHVPGWKSTYHAVSSLCFPHSRSWLKVNLSCSILTLFPSFTFLTESQPIMQYPHLVSLLHVPGWKSTYHAVSSLCFPHSHSWL